MQLTMISSQSPATNQEVVKVCPTVEDLGWQPANVGGRFVCPASSCSMVTSTRGSLMQHINSTHPTLSKTGPKNSNKNQRYQYHCPQKTCVYNLESERYFDTFQRLKTHYATQHWEKRHVCQKCGKRFGLGRDWRRHEAVCGTVFACERCFASYPSRQALLVHCQRKQHPVPSSLNSTKNSTASKKNVCETQKQTDLSRGEHHLQDCGKSHESVPATSSSTQSGCPKKSPKRNSISKHSNDQVQRTPHDVGFAATSTLSHNNRSEYAPDTPAKVKQTRSGGSAVSPYKTSPRLILPKTLLPPVIHVFDANTSPKPGGLQTCSSQSSAQIQTDISGITPLYQRFAGAGVNSGSQTKITLNESDWSSQTQRQASVAHMGTQVSVPFLRNMGNSQISDMATQVSVPLIRNIDSALISDTATQVSVKLVNNSTQIACDSFCEETSRQMVSVENASIQVSSNMANIATQINCGPPVTSAGVQTGRLGNMSNTASQATVICVDNGTQLFLSPHLMQPVQVLDGVCQTPQMSMGHTTTSTQGTQIFFSPILADTTNTSSTGMQTSVSLLPNRQQRYHTIAQTQTSGDHIIKTAMVKAKLAVPGSASRSGRRNSGSPGRKRSVKSSEVQTSTTLPKKRLRRGRQMPQPHSVGVMSTQTPARTYGKRDTDAVSMADLLDDFSGDGNVLSRQNPTLSSSADMDDNSSEADLQFHDLLASSPSALNSTSDTSMQVDFEDFLSSYTSDLGVQTHGDFLALCTADGSAQTQDDFLEICTAELGVQTATTSFSSLLENLETSMNYSAVQDEMVMGHSQNSKDEFSEALDAVETSRTASLVDCGIGTDVLQSDMHTQTAQPFLLRNQQFSNFVDSGTSPDIMVADMHTQTSHHIPTQTVSISESASMDCATETDMFISNSRTQTRGTGQEPDNFTLDFQFESGQMTSIPSFGNNSIITGCESGRSLQWESLYGDGAACENLALSSGDMAHASTSSLTGAGFNSTNATDMHTQTADDLLDFLMTNMETQTTEDIFTHSLELADIQTQTMSDTSPLRPSSGSRSPFASENCGVVSAETQTSCQLALGDGSDLEDLSEFADMETQTAFDILDICRSPIPPNSGTLQTPTSNSTLPAASTKPQCPVTEFGLDSF